MREWLKLQNEQIIFIYFFYLKMNDDILRHTDALTVKYMAYYMKELLRMSRGWDVCKITIDGVEYTATEFRKYYKKLRHEPDKRATLYLSDKGFEYIINSKDFYLV